VGSRVAHALWGRNDSDKESCPKVTMPMTLAKTTGKRLLEGELERRRVMFLPAEPPAIHASGLAGRRNPRLDKLWVAFGGGGLLFGVFGD